MEKRELIVSQLGALTFDEFKEKISGLIESGTVIDKASDRYEKLPIIIRAIQNLDPTGISGAIDQVLSNNKAKREQENLMHALYAFYEAILYLGNKQAVLDSSINQQLSELTYLYFQKSQETYDNRKIEYYKNIWINGVISNVETLEEKAYVFNIVSSLSIDEIILLASMVRRQGLHTFRDREPMTINDVAGQLGFTTHRSQQLCIGLSGKGLLHDYGLGRYDYAGPVKFVITDYVMLISKYLERP